MRVLLAEDNAISCRVLEAILLRRGHSVCIAVNGAEACAWAAAEEFDAILMDMQMPVMDGLEAARQIRAQDGPCRSRPIIALTANSGAGDEARCLEAGMNGFLVKPVDGEAIDRALGQMVCAPTGEAGDEAALRRSVDLLGAEAVREVARRFDDLIDELAAAIASGEGIDIARSAHGIAGCARYLGLTELGQACSTLEAAWHAGDSALVGVRATEAAPLIKAARAWTRHCLESAVLRPQADHDPVAK